jgi:hypothetical protein
MRRTKDSRDRNGKAIIDLPAKHHNLVFVEFSEDE